MKNTKKVLTTLMGVLLLLTLIPLIGYAEVPRQITYQGQMTDQYGDPVPDGDYDMTFAIYDVPTGGTALWAEAQTVTVTKGIYNVILGQPGNELNLDDFDGDLCMGVQVGTDAEMTPRQPLTSVGYALRAAVADSVAEGAVTEIMIEDNAVTTAKVADNAITEQKLGNATVTTVKIQDGATLSEISDDDGAGSGLDADLFDGYDSSVFASAAYVSSLESRIEDLETQVAQLVALLQGVTRAGNDITFGGVNVHVVNGTGTTAETVNGLGNLIVGYNELRGTGDDRTGSHNIVVGSYNNYSSYGGLVAGYWNTISNAYASVSGGRYNEASGAYASVSGGHINTASGNGSSVSGGYENTASGNYASVSGGDWNTASGTASAVSGGDLNTASGVVASISGGQYNEASGSRASVSGGYSNTASGEEASVSGGVYNTASGNDASVSGGAENTASGYSASVSGGIHNKASGVLSFVGGGGGTNSSDGNEAFARYSAILGGYKNVAGDPLLTDQTIGEHSTVSGGNDNNASGKYSSISGGAAGQAKQLSSSVCGGWQNTADGNYSSILGGRLNTTSYGSATVSGGASNTASGLYATVSGGEYNTASGMASAVSGGNTRSVSGDDDWRAGDYFQDN